MPRDWKIWAARGALPLGAALLLLALIMLAEGRTDTSGRGTVLRWRLESSLARQGGCLSCHVLPASGPPDAADLALAGAQHDPIALPEARPSTPSPRAITLDARLRDVGARLLSLPINDHAQVQAAAEQYLAVLEGARGERTVSALQTLRDLAAVEALVRALENQASPHQVRVRPGTPDDAPPAAPPGYGPPLLDARLPGWLLEGIVGAARPVALLALVTLPALAVVLVKRRGPPVCAATPEFGWEGRSPLHGLGGGLPFLSSRAR